MPIAAVPDYLGRDFSSAPPALRFGMYLELWGVDGRTGRHLWTTHDENYRVAGRNREERLFKDENKTAALRRAAALTEGDRSAMVALLSRQRALSCILPKNETYTLTASAVAPFVTGLGNEHPLENGFAFLNPYGLPYLPGSGVKGAVRRAAEELTHADFFGSSGEWALPDVWHMFGFEPWPLPRDEADRRSWEDRIRGFAVGEEGIDKYLDAVLGWDSAARGDFRQRLDEQQDNVHGLYTLLDERGLHARGALDFWDVIPQIAGESLAIEIMAPHQSHYYQDNGQHGGGSSTPHDSGSPNPISFLAVPVGSAFTFHVRCDLARLHRVAPRLAAKDRWKRFIEAAFEHAFEWLGFGAKTSVGYGAMERDCAWEGRAAVLDEEARAQAERDERERRERLAAMDPVERAVEDMLEARPDKGVPEITAIVQALQANRWTGSDKVQVARQLKDRMRQARRWKETSQKKNPKKDKDYQNTLFVKRCLEEAGDRADTHLN